jgi:hypothetical protein
MDVCDVLAPDKALDIRIVLQPYGGTGNDRFPPIAAITGFAMAPSFAFPTLSRLPD